MLRISMIMLGAAFPMAAALPSGAVMGASEPLDLAQPLADADLEAIRGGFETGSGLQISFGLEQVTSINGVLQTRMAFYIPNIVGSEPGAVKVDDWTSNVIQNGAGNTLSLAATDQIPAAVLNVVQNTLDHQVIQNLTVIDLNMTGLEAFRQHLFQSFLSQPRF